MTHLVLPLLFGLFLVLGAGVVLRATGRMGDREADVLQQVVLDVTLPALLIVALGRGGRSGSGALALVVALVTTAVAAAAAYAIARSFGVPGPARGAALLAGGFSNTGFLGVPLLVAVYPADGAVARTAVAIDALATTVGMWLIAAPIAARVAGAPRAGTGVATVLALVGRPFVVALLLGLALGALGVDLPVELVTPLDAVGRCTSPLVFLALGLQLDLRAVAGRVGLVLALVGLQLVLEPLLALGLVTLAGLSGKVAAVVVLQAAMPSAMASVVVAADSGCDRKLTVAVAMLSTLCCAVTIPAMAALLGG